MKVTFPALSSGWLRQLHTLNVDENDLEDLPPEIGSCRHMKILSVHGNKLSGLVSCRAANEPSAMFSQSRRRPLLGPLLGPTTNFTNTHRRLTFI